MTLIFAIRREIERLLALVGNRHRMSRLRGEEAKSVVELGREAWRTQRHLDVSERLQEDIRTVENEIRQRNGEVAELERLIFEEDPALAERHLKQHGGRLRALKAEALSLQSKMDAMMRSLGRALDASRPYDHVLQEGYGRLDRARSEMQEQGERFRRIRNRFITVLPLALIELVLLVALIGAAGYFVYQHTLEAKTVVNDHFDGRIMNWFTYSDAVVDMNVRGGHFAIHGKKDGLSFKTWCYTDVTERSFRFEAKVWLIKGPGPIGLVFRYVRNRDDYYVLEVSGDGRYRLSVYAGKRWRHLTEWQDLPDMSARRNWVTLAVECSGKTISLFAGGKRLDKIVDDAIDTGHVGFYAYGETHAQFDDVVVTVHKSMFKRSD